MNNKKKKINKEIKTETVNKRAKSEFKPPRTDFDGLIQFDRRMRGDMIFLNEIKKLCDKHGVSIDQPLEDAIGKLHQHPKDCDKAEELALQVKDWGAWGYGLNTEKLHQHLWNEYKFDRDVVGRYMDEEKLLDAERERDERFEAEYDRELAEKQKSKQK